MERITIIGRPVFRDAVIAPIAAMKMTRYALCYTYTHVQYTIWPSTRDANMNETLDNITTCALIKYRDESFARMTIKLFIAVAVIATTISKATTWSSAWLGANIYRTERSIIRSLSMVKRQPDVCTLTLLQMHGIILGNCPVRRMPQNIWSILALTTWRLSRFMSTIERTNRIVR